MLEEILKLAPQTLGQKILIIGGYGEVGYTIAKKLAFFFPRKLSLPGTI